MIIGFLIGLLALIMGCGVMLYFICVDLNKLHQAQLRLFGDIKKNYGAILTNKTGADMAMSALRLNLGVLERRLQGDLATCVKLPEVTMYTKEKTPFMWDPSLTVRDLQGNNPVDAVPLKDVVAMILDELDMKLVKNDERRFKLVVDEPEEEGKV